MVSSTLANIWLVPIAGPALEPIQLTEKPEGLIVGRHEECDICLPADAEKVSRFHSRFAFHEGRWCVADLNSRWGTFVNGCRVNPGPDVPLSDGDLIRITPWTFTLSPTPRRRGLQSMNDTGQTVVRAVTPERAAPLQDDMLALLLESAAAIHGAMDEKQLAEMVMDSALRGTGLTNAAMLRVVDAAGTIEVMGSRMAQKATESGGVAAAYSRSLIAAAGNGVVAEISGNAPLGDISQSIVQMKINSAICVPLMLGTTVAAYLYLDSRGASMQMLRQNASAFCVALGRMASLALANLKRIDMEKREERIRADFAAAAAAQKWIMPKRQTCHGVFNCLGESRAGQYVGGDFFDIIPLSSTRLAVAVGDVSGKGIEASVLMTAAQGFLHASLREHTEPGRAATELNNYINPRRPENKFLTMWVGVFDSEQKTIHYVDCGHSYAIIRRADGSFQQLNEGGGFPIGLDESGSYRAASAEFGPGDMMLVVSDGIIEQFGLVTRDDASTREQFELGGVQKSLVGNSDDAVADLFHDVITHAGTSQLSDDATAVLVRW